MDRSSGSQGLQQGLEQGLEQAREQGREQGLEQGKLRGMLTLIEHQLERRFGPIDARAQQQIRELSTDQLERLGEDLVDFNDANDLARWLEEK